MIFTYKIIFHNYAIVITCSEAITAFFTWFHRVKLVRGQIYETVKGRKARGKSENWLFTDDKTPDGRDLFHQ